MKNGLIECVIGLSIMAVGSYLVMTNGGWNLLWGIFLLLWANNIGLKYNAKTSKQRVSNQSENLLRS
jgi:hypothetical protein